MDGPARHADGDHQVHGDGHRQVWPHGRVQTVRGPGLSTDHRRVRALVPRTFRLTVATLPPVVLPPGCRRPAESPSNKLEGPPPKTLSLRHDPKPEVGSIVRAS